MPNHWKKGPNNEEENNWVMSTIVQKVKTCSDMEHSAKCNLRSKLITRKRYRSLYYPVLLPLF